MDLLNFYIYFYIYSKTVFFFSNVFLRFKVVDAHSHFYKKKIHPTGVLTYNRKQQASNCTWHIYYACQVKFVLYNSITVIIIIILYKKNGFAEHVKLYRNIIVVAMSRKCNWWKLARIRYFVSRCYGCIDAAAAIHGQMCTATRHNKCCPLKTVQQPPPPPPPSPS